MRPTEPRLVIEPDCVFRDGCWIDATTLALTTPDGAVRGLTLPLAARGEQQIATVPIAAAEAVMAPLRAAFSFPLGGPASGTYPLIAAAPTGALAVFTHDLVLAVRPPGEVDWRFSMGGFGLYYPTVSCSADGAWGLAQADDAYAFEFATGRLLPGLGPDAGLAAWHPARFAVIRYDFAGELIELACPSLAALELPDDRDARRAAIAAAVATAEVRRWCAPWLEGEATFADEPDAMHWRADGSLEVALRDALLHVDPTGCVDARLELDDARDVEPAERLGFWVQRGDRSHALWQWRAGDGWVQRLALPPTVRQPRLSGDHRWAVAADPLPSNPYPGAEGDKPRRRLHLWPLV